MTNLHDNTPEAIGHEPTTIGARGILFALVCLAAAVIVAMAAIAGLQMHFARADVADPLVGPPEPAATPVAPPPGVPELDPRQAGQLRRLREREQQLLTEYGWADRAEGLARIPVRRAMELLAEEPPAKPQPNQ